MKLIYIEWADATSPQEGWWTEERTKEWAHNESYCITQVGWVIEETKEYLLLSSQKNHTANGSSMDTHYAHIVKIPKTWIRKRKTLKV